VFVVSGSQSSLSLQFEPTHLVNRYVLLNLYPFSFREFVEAKGVASPPDAHLKELLEEYLRVGGFPGACLSSVAKAREEVESIYTDILTLSTRPATAEARDLSDKLLSDMGILTTTKYFQRFPPEFEYLFNIFMFHKHSSPAGLARIYCADVSLGWFGKVGGEHDEEISEFPLAAENTVYMEFKRRKAQYGRHRQELLISYPKSHLPFIESGVDFALNHHHYASVIKTLPASKKSGSKPVLFTIRKRIQGLLTALLFAPDIRMCTLIYIQREEPVEERFKGLLTPLRKFLCAEETDIAWLLRVILSVASKHFPVGGAAVKHIYIILGKAATFLVYLIIGGVLPAVVSFCPPLHLDQNFKILMLESICREMFPYFMRGNGW